MNSFDYKILLVEGDLALAENISTQLKAYAFEIEHCSSGQAALELLRTNAYDLLITELNIPHTDTAEFFDELENGYPQLKIVVLTAASTDKYMDIFSQFNMGTVLVKKNPFDFDDLKNAIEQKITTITYGLPHYLGPKAEIQTIKVRQPQDIEKTSVYLADLYSSHCQRDKMLTMLSELLTNAVYYGARRENSEDKSLWKHDFVLSDEECIIVSHGIDNKKIGFSITDQGGLLNQKSILYWLNRQTTPGPNGLPQGLLDSHGRGIYIARKLTDLLLINIEPGKRSECIVINWLDQAQKSSNKPLIINEYCCPQKK